VGGNNSSKKPPQLKTTTIDKMALGTEKLLDHLWTASGASYTFNVCTNAASDSYRDLGKGVATVVDVHDYLMGLSDPRVANWPLMSSPLPTLAITLLYLWFVMRGPAWMQKRKPWDVRPLILVYNAAVAGLNLYIGVELFLTSRQLDFSWTCEPVDYTNNPLALRVASALWCVHIMHGYTCRSQKNISTISRWYYASKLFEMLDSAFFVLRKKPEQLTFLHIYHHSTMFCLWWIGVKYVAGGSSFLGAMFNCYVHVLMYVYYFLSAIGPEMRKRLWWKKYLTIIQMAQFVFALIMGINAIRVGCDFPMWMQYSANAYMVSFLVLFSRYFLREYGTAKAAKKKQ
jgi:elongation of very long chain fatty acids protein 4